MSPLALSTTTFVASAFRDSFLVTGARVASEIGVSAPSLMRMLFKINK